MTQGPVSYEETNLGSQVGQHGGQMRPCLSKGTGTSDTGKSSGSLPSLPSRGGDAKRLSPHLGSGLSGLRFGAYLIQQLERSSTS